MSAESKPDESKGPTVEDLMMPKTKEEKGMYILRAQAFVEENARKTKKNFIAFVNWYKANQNQFVLKEEETDALVKLHAMWKTVKIKGSSLPIYFDMKEHHNKLNGRFLSGLNGGPESVAWKKYIHEFMSWRCAAMRDHYFIAKFLIADGMMSPSALRRVC